MYAILGGYVTIVKYLLQQGASSYPEDVDSYVAQDYITKYSNSLLKQDK